MRQNSAAEKREGAKPSAAEASRILQSGRLTLWSGDSVQDGCRHRVNPYCCRPCS